MLYTGNSGTQSITGVGFSPDWLWIKNREATYSHALVDSVRGATLSLSSDSTAIERTSDITSLDSDGFSLQFVNATGTYSENQGTQTYVAWNWKAGTAFSNDASATSVGTIDSTGSVNTKAGFSIISYTGNGSSSQTVAHGLSSTPEFIILKDRETNSNNNQWQAFHAFANFVTDGDDYGYLSTTAAFTGSAQIIPSGTTTFELKANLATTNESGDDYIAYCFHSVEGYSKVGGYIGNGATSGSAGAYVYTGFRPAWVLVKRANSTGNWWILDSKRDPYNEALRALKANDTDDETGYSGNFLDFYSNGFALRTSGAEVNASGGKYIYLAFAEAPFKYANAR